MGKPANVEKSGKNLGSAKTQFRKGERLPHQGRGPAKGAPNAGRPRDEWKRELQRLASSDAVLSHLQKVVDAGPDHPYFAKALDYLTDHGYGKAAQSLDVTSGGEPLTIRITRDE